MICPWGCFRALKLLFDLAQMVHCCLREQLHLVAIIIRAESMTRSVAQQKKIIGDYFFYSVIKRFSHFQANMPDVSWFQLLQKWGFSAFMIANEIFLWSGLLVRKKQRLFSLLIHLSINFSIPKFIVLSIKWQKIVKNAIYSLSESMVMSSDVLLCKIISPNLKVFNLLSYVTQSVQFSHLRSYKPAFAFLL